MEPAPSAHPPPAPWSELFATDLYRGEIAYADAALARLLDQLDALGEAERTIVVMTADHGEGHGEHGEETHAILAHDATLHVPLIFKVPGALRPGQEGRRVAERVGTVDILPTLLELLDLPIPREVQGRSLVELWNAAARSRRSSSAGSPPILNVLSPPATSCSPRGKQTSPSLDPRHRPARFNLASALSRLGRGAEALPHLDELVRLDPAHLRARRLSVELRAALGEHDAACRDLRAGLLSFPQAPELLTLVEQLGGC